jgi:hypothetical protein
MAKGLYEATIIDYGIFGLQLEPTLETFPKMTISVNKTLIFLN